MAILQIHVNGTPYFASVSLKPYPGTTIEVYLRPSSELQPVGANRINIYPLSSGIFPRLSIGLAIDDPNIVFEGSEIPARRRGELKGVLEIDASQFQQIPTLTFGVGLVCISPAAPQSIRHINIATTPDFSDTRQKTDWPRILTVDRVLPDDLDQRKVKRRSEQSKQRYRDDKSLPQREKGQHLDEYPPAVFLENLGVTEAEREDGEGKAHVKPIDGGDNSRSGANIVNHITGPGGKTNPIHKNGDQVEIVTPDSGLSCPVAF